MTDPKEQAQQAQPERRKDDDEQARNVEAAEAQTRRSRRISGRQVTAAGLAASSIAALAAAGTQTGRRPVSPAPLPPAPPPEEAAVKEVSWDLTVTDHDRVDFFIEFLMGRNRDKTQLWLERTGRYAPMIVKELRARGMPEDLLYLAMIESGFNPDAYSRAHAAGLWQFIAETGQRYGLEVSPYVDERRDPVKATTAALTYLQQMYDRFGSWYLAAAGYNTGENRVGRLMRETTGSERGEDAQYWDIWDRLPRETRDYVPLMLAAGHISKEPEKYGFVGVEHQRALEFEEVIVPGGTKLTEVALAAGVDEQEVRELNRHFVRGVTPPNRRMAVRVPLGRAEVVAANLSAPVERGEVYLAE